MQSPILLGRPQFGDPKAAELHAQGDLLGAWQQVLSNGPAGLAAMGGSFAVALTDRQGRQVLAVDRFATHSLCYRQDENGLRVAERADMLGDGRPDLDSQALFDYLYFHCIPSPRTVFAGVHRLPAAHMAVYEQGRMNVQAYWTPTFKPAPGADFGGLRAEFRDLLKAAVQRQLGGDRPACFLSGGTDSSTVAGMIAAVTGGKAATYSIGFDAAGYDEMAFARIAARHFATDHHEYYVTPDDLVAGIPQVARHYDQPFGNSSALPAYYCARMAHDQGVTRLLAGDGGDELFGGNSRYAKQRVFGWYGHVPAALRRAVMEPLLLSSAGRALPLLRKGASYVEQARVPMPDRLQMYNLLLRLGADDVFTPDLLARVDQGSPLLQQQAVWRSALANDEIDRTLAYDWRYTLAESDLPKVSMTTQLAGVGVGYPFLDSDLVDFSMRLPTEYKLKGLKLRWFFKEALRGFLPDEIITKKKQGFGLPFGVWALRHDGLRTLAVDSLGSLGTRGIVRPAFIKTLLEDRLREHPGYYGEMVWILMMLEQWLQGHAAEFRI